MLNANATPILSCAGAEEQIAVIDEVGKNVPVAIDVSDMKNSKGRLLARPCMNTA